MKERAYKPESWIDPRLELRPSSIHERGMFALDHIRAGELVVEWGGRIVSATDIERGLTKRNSVAEIGEGVYLGAFEDDPESIEFMKMYRSANHLAVNFEAYPLLLLGFALGDPTGSSIFPSIWNAMLAARAEGVGSAITSVLLFKEREMFEILGVPAEEGWKFACLVTMGYPTGRWDVAPRRPVHEVSYRNAWGESVGFEIPEPLWPTEG